jgi:PAS domain S-box-containing protein
MKLEIEMNPACDEMQRRKLQEYLFGLEEIQEKAEELAVEHESLKRSREILTAVLRGTVHAICLIIDDRFIWCNQAMSDIFGWTQEELVGKTTGILCPTEKAHEEMMSRIHESLSGAGRVSFECELLDNNANPVPCRMTAGALDRLSLEKGYVLSFTDVTGQRNAEEELRRAHEELERKVHERTNELSESNARLILEVEARKFAEEKLRRQYEYLAGLHETAKGLMSRLELQDLLEAIVVRAAGLLQTEHGFVYLMAPDGEELELRVATGHYGKQTGYRLKPGEGVAGKVFLAGGPMAVNRYQSWEGRSPDARWSVIQSVMAVPLKSQSQIVGVIGLGHVERDREFQGEEIEAFGRFAELASIALDNARLHEDLQEELARRKRTEEALLASEQKFRSVFNESKDCIYLVNPETKGLIEANPAFSALLGYDRREIQDLTVYDFMDYRTEEIDRGLALVLSARSHYIGERRFRTRSGRIVDVEVNGNVLPLGGEKLVCMICRDITERKRMREAILRADKLTSVGVLAGGIAHDFNNILTAIMGNIGLARMYTKTLDKAGKHLQEAERACLRAKDLTQQLLTFSKGGAPIKETTSIVDVIRESTAFALSGSCVGCRFEISQDLWPVDIDTGQISQVIGNLVVNAKDAMPEGGVIRITVENRILDTNSGFPLQSGRYIRVSIKDEGVGIPEKHLNRIFDPYFTTKQKGSGLGLATCYSIVKKHDGHVDLESRLGVGTTFHVYLPASEKEAPHIEAVDSAPPGGKGRVLVMDDEEAVREIAAEMLQYLGYEVISASDGKEAIELYEEAAKKGCSFHAIIMDLTIPGGVGGKEAIGTLLAKHPSANAIVSSGYSNDPIMSDFSRYGFKGVVTKPYTVKELGDVLKRVLSSR